MVRRKTLPGAPRKFAKTVTLSLHKSNFVVIRFTRFYRETSTAVKFRIHNGDIGNRYFTSEKVG